MSKVVPDGLREIIEQFHEGKTQDKSAEPKESMREEELKDNFDKAQAKIDAIKSQE